MPAEDEADALAALFARPAAAPLPQATPVAGRTTAAEPGRTRLVAALAGSALALGLVPLVADLIGRLPAIAGMLAAAALLAAIGYAASLVAGVPLLGTGKRIVARGGQGLALGIGGLAWCALALALGHRLAGGATALAGLWPVGLLCVLAQTASEEILFRGWFQTGLARLLPIWPALVLAALLFGSAHVLGGDRAPLSLANITLAGLFFGVLAWRTGGLAAPIAAHFGWNAAEQLVFGFDPNPGCGPFGTLFDFDIAATPLWGGSAEGLNASIVATPVLVALLLVALALRPAGAQPE